jgi:hypothetical protein
MQCLEKKLIDILRQLGMPSFLSVLVFDEMPT